MKKKEKLFLGGEINLSELDVDVQKKYEVAKELGIYDQSFRKGLGFTYSRRDRKSGRSSEKERTPGKEFFLSLA